jgi:signal transduction histidine kinase
VLDRDSRAQIIIVNAILFTIGWAVTWMLTSRVRSAAELRERASRLERERDAAAEAAVAEERARIARELHDVVAHSVSVMTVQAGGVRRLLGDGEGHKREREALASIEETGRRALAEMRRMVTVMRASGARPELAPQPGVAALPRLVDEVCEAGLPVTLTVDGAADLPPGIDLSVYRIVQEALTNVRKHAGPAHAHVTVALGPSAVEVVVDDDGAGAGGRNGGGHGLIGMRERVAVYGGELESGDRPGGGFRVRALLPLDQPPGVGA